MNNIDSNKNNDVFFSVLVPVYNVENYIVSCLESILNQNYTNYEVILVDDGSTDNSGIICDEYSKKNSRIKVFHKKNEGLFQTRGVAIDKAKGEYLLFIDSDDYYEANTFQILNQMIKKYTPDCVIFGIQRVFEGQRIGKPFNNTKREEEILKNKKELYIRVLLDDSYNSLCRKAVRRQIIGGTDYKKWENINRAEDLLRSVEIYQKSERVLFLKKILYNYTFNPSSITHNISIDNYNLDTFKIREYVHSFLKQQNNFDDSDWKKVREYYVRMICREIHMISRFNTSIKNRENYFCQVKNTECYKFCENFNDELPENIPRILDRIMYTLLRKSKYKMMCIIGNMIRVIKHFVK